ncbi:MAG: 3'-5' exonuclease, partial [Candidatus Syntrophosphaera sp.]|nr:3'-5' exonuclease [Candidatus Syntrophosphaera sp.]
PSDNNSLLRIINEPPRGIGTTSVSRLLEYASQAHITLYQTIQNVQAVQTIQPGIRKKIAEFAEKLEDWHRKAQSTPVLDLVKEVIDSLDLINHYKNSQDPVEISRVENLIEFVSSVSEFSERWIEEYDKSPLLADFLPFVALQTDIDRVNETADTVYLMTLHNAKGLEFESVFITGLEQELLPHLRSMNSKYSIEEERRLLYVGVTRAKSRLFLSYARSRRKYDSFYFTEPSIFLQELDPNLFAGYNDAITFKRIPNRKTYIKPKSLTNKQFYIGQKVWHSEYGQGLVLNVDGTGPEARLTISFTSGKLAKIIASYVSPEPF